MTQVNEEKVGTDESKKGQTKFDHVYITCPSSATLILKCEPSSAVISRLSFITSVTILPEAMCNSSVSRSISLLLFNSCRVSGFSEENAWLEGTKAVYRSPDPCSSYTRPDIFIKLANSLKLSDSATSTMFLSDV